MNEKQQSIKQMLLDAIKPCLHCDLNEHGAACTCSDSPTYQALINALSVQTELIKRLTQYFDHYKVDEYHIAESDYDRGYHQALRDLKLWMETSND